jgi:hypothetical protein
MFDFHKKRPRKLPAWQAYSKIYYESKLKPIVQEQWNKKFLKDNPHHGSKRIPAVELKFRNAAIQVLFEAESTEVKEEVKRWQEVSDDIGDVDGETEAQERERKQRAVDRQRFAHQYWCWNSN